MESDHIHIGIERNPSQLVSQQIELAQIKLESDPQIQLQSQESFKSNVDFSHEQKQIEGNKDQISFKNASSYLHKSNEAQSNENRDIPLGISKKQSSSIIQAFTEIKQALQADEQIQKVLGNDEPPLTKLKIKSKNKKSDKKTQIKERFRYMDEHKISVDQLFQNLDLQDFRQGLNNKAVEEHLIRDGDNLLTEKKGTP